MTARPSEAPDVDRLARSMLLLHGGHDDDEHDHAASDGGGRILVQGTGFRVRSGTRRRGARGHRSGTGTAT